MFDGLQEAIDAAKLALKVIEDLLKPLAKIITGKIKESADLLTESTRLEAKYLKEWNVI